MSDNITTVISRGVERTASRHKRSLHSLNFDPPSTSPPLNAPTGPRAMRKKPRFAQSLASSLLPRTAPIKAPTAPRSMREPIRELSRPIAEPPCFNYDRFVEENIPSDLKYKILFPDDISKRTDYRDLRTERDLLAMYIDWNDALLQHCEVTSGKRVFYEGLREGLEYDWKETVREKNKLNRFTTPLAKWEFRNLDNDGKTEGIRRKIEMGYDVFDAKGGREARNKYGFLLERRGVV